MGTNEGHTVTGQYDVVRYNMLGHVKRVYFGSDITRDEAEHVAQLRNRKASPGNWYVSQPAKTEGE